MGQSASTRRGPLPAWPSRRWLRWSLAAGTIVLFSAAAEARAQSSTIWSFLGVPTNASAQASSNPAIAAAAQQKAAIHEIPKKKKALQFLAGMGCSPEHPEVAAAILAAMGDPAEPVRYEAVKAVLQTAAACQSRKEQRASRKALSLGDRCHMFKQKIDKAICGCIDRLCGKAPPKEHKHKLKDLIPFGKKDCPEEPENCDKGQGNCCTQEIRDKLQQLATARDERGCFLERSARVRELAAEALKACSSCGDGPCGACQGRGAREMPPEESREMQPTGNGVNLDADCVYDSVLVPAPVPVEEPQSTPIPESVPAAEIVPAPIPEPQEIPAPVPEPVPAAEVGPQPTGGPDPEAGPGFEPRGSGTPVVPVADPAAPLELPPPEPDATEES